MFGLFGKLKDIQENRKKRRKNFVRSFWFLFLIVALVLLVIVIAIVQSILEETGTINNEYEVPDDILFDLYTSMYDMEDLNSFIEPYFLANTNVNILANANMQVYYGARVYPLDGSVYSIQKNGKNSYSIILTSDTLTIYIDGLTHISDEIDRHIRDMLIEEKQEEMLNEIMEWHEEYNRVMKSEEEVEIPELPFQSYIYREEEEEELLLWHEEYNFAEYYNLPLPEPPIPEDYFNEQIYYIEYGELKNGEYIIRYGMSNDRPVAYAGRLPYYLGEGEPDTDTMTDRELEKYNELVEQALNADPTLKLTVKLYDGNGDKLSRFKTKMVLMAMSGFSVNGEFDTDMGAQEFMISCANHVGLPYVWGAESLVTGADCSGFCQATYQEYLGLTLPSGARYQVRQGVAVTQEALRAGDLVFFCTDSARAVELGTPVTHVGIFIGNDMFIHAAGTSTGCIISRFSGKYEEIFVAGKRFMKSTDYMISNWTVGIEKIDRADIDMLAKLVEAECKANGSEPSIFGHAIASYIYNKTICGMYQDKITETIANSTELKSVSNGTYLSYAPSDDAYESVYKAVVGIDYVMGATYMKYADNENVDYTDKQYLLTIDGAVFYRDYSMVNEGIINETEN